ncbi:MAG TPA: tetratricopeptide repeat protein, partial [Chloroflexota bacterium]|nr:tetratricopeptide repeat protein [Chloroflexota bacterium]
RAGESSASPPSPGRRLRPGTLPLVGRARERAALERQVGGAGPPMLLLAGEPGSGKTRLLKHALEYAGRAGLRALVGGCQRQGDQMPYAPLLETLQSYLRSQSAARLRTELHGCAWLVRLLPELAEGPIEPLPAWLLPPEQERRLMGEAVGRFLENVAGPAGTLLVLDDLQWAGADALALLTTLTRSMTSGRLRVIGAYRDTEVRADAPLGVMLADLAQAGLATQRRLGPLTPDESDTLLNRLLAEREAAGALDVQVRERLLNRAGGMPFFLVSYAQGLSDGALEEGVPWDVAQGVRQRIAALPETAQEVLNVAAVTGRVVPRSVLLRVTGHPEEQVLPGLEAACRAGLLMEQGEHDYEITHDVIREVVEAGLSTARRTVLHRQIAAALAATPGEPPVELVAYHYARTEEHAEAAQWLERAGDTAAARFAKALAVEQYEAARAQARACGAAEALSRLDEKLGDLRMVAGDFAQAQEDYARALMGTRAPERGVEQAVGGGALSATEARTIPPQHNSVARRAELRRKEGDTWERRGEYARALEAFAAAEAEGEVDGAGPGLPKRVRAELELSRGSVYQGQGDYDASAAAAERAGALLSAESATEAGTLALGRAFNLQGSVAFRRGDLARAEDWFQRGLAIRERIDAKHASASSWNNLGRVAFRRGDLAQAEERFQRSLTIQDQIGDQQGSAGAWHNLGAVARDRGDLARAEDCYQRSLALSDRIGVLTISAHCWHNLGILARDRGDLARAEECFQRSLDLAERMGDVNTSAHCRHNLGMVARDRGDLARAEERTQQGLEVFERIGDQHGCAECWTTLGTIACERGAITEAAARCRTARRLARRLDLSETETLATVGQARARLRAGHTRAADALLDHARKVASAHGLLPDMAHVMLATAEAQLCRISMAQGSLETALPVVQEALRLARQGGYRREEALAQRLLGLHALAEARPAAAEAPLRAALTMLEEMGATLEVARTRLALADALARRARRSAIPPEALTLLALARVTFATVGAAWDLSEAEHLAASWEDHGDIQRTGR